MNLKISEWDNINKYADKVCVDLKNKGFNVKPKQYDMYDGRKGLYLQVFDNNDRFYTQYATGTWNNETEMKKAIDEMVKMIIAEA